MKHLFSGRIGRLILLILLVLISLDVTFSQTWTRIAPQFSTGDTSVNLHNCVFVKKNIAWAVDNFHDIDYIFHSRLYKTTDGGYYWELQKEWIQSDIFRDPAAMDSLNCWYLCDGTTYANYFFFDSSEGLCIEQNTNYTSDGGFTWQLRDTIAQFQGVSGIDFLDKNIGWVVSPRSPWATDVGMIAKTTDCGYSWKYQGIPLDTDKIIAPYIMDDIDCIDTNIVYAIGQNFGGGGFFLYTIDGGDWWQSKSMYGVVNDIKFYNANTGWIVGDSGIVWSTTNSGSTWTKSYLGTTNHLTKINILPDERRIYISGSNSALFTADIITSIGAEKETPKKYSLLHNYPNPFNSRTKINFIILNREMVQIDVYNVLGRKVKTLMKKVLDPGQHKILFDASGLPSGVYYYSMVTSTQRITKKMLFIQ